MRIAAVVGIVLLGMGMGSGVGWAGSVKTRAEEVVVTATRTDQPRHQLTKSVSFVTGEMIERQRTDATLEVLRTVPGVFIRRSGAAGRTTSAIIRGSSDDQVLVFIDGAEASSPTLGSFNFANLPADFIERIEVLRGSSSTLYGSKAIGGVINITTKRGTGPARTSYLQEFGTLRTFRETLATQGEAGRLGYHLGVNRLDSRGLSTGDDVEQTHVAATSNVELLEQLQWDVALNFGDSHVGIDDGAFRPDPNRFIEREHLVLSTTLTGRPIEAWEQELRLTLNDDDVLDIDLGNPGTTQAFARSRINSTRYGVDWLHRLHLAPIGLTTLGAEIRDEEAEVSSFSKTAFIWAGFLQHQLDPTEHLTLIGGVRQTHHNFFGHETTAEGSASYRIPATGTRLRSSYSQGYRAPDLNDLFFPNFGNVNLLPETSDTIEFGVGQAWCDGRFDAELTAFRTEVEQLIQAVRVTPTTTQAQNISQAQMEGVELEGRAELRPDLHLSTHWTYTDAFEEPSGEELTRTPRYVAGVGLDYDFLSRWQLHLEALQVGHTEESVATNRRQRVKHYLVVDGALTFRATDHFQLYGRVENLLDEKYHEVLGFQTPGTLFFIGGKVEM